MQPFDFHIYENIKKMDGELLKNSKNGSDGKL
jgi:hypothetical protein